MKSRWEKIVLIALVLSFSVGCDQTTKRVAEHTLKGTPMRSMLGDTIRLQYAENTGAFLGLGAHLPQEWKFWIFLLLPMLALSIVTIVSVFSRRITRLQLWMLMLVVGGGWGNLIDRFFVGGRVTDFLNLGIGTLRTGIFNIADVAIMVGTIGLIASGFWHSSTTDQPTTDQPTTNTPLSTTNEMLPTPIPVVYHPSVSSQNPQTTEHIDPHN